MNDFELDKTLCAAVPATACLLNVLLNLVIDEQIQNEKAALLEVAAEN